MSDPVLVHPVTPGGIRREDLDELVEGLRSGGLDARPARVEGEGFGVDQWYEIVAIWIALEASKAVINQAVTEAVEWARERFRRSSEEESGHLRGLPRSSRRHKGLRVEIVEHESNEGQVVEVVEIDAEDAEPVRRPPEGYERNTRFRPSERAGGERAAPAENISQELPALDLPALTGEKQDLLRENRERLYNRARLHPRDAVLDAWLLIEAGAQAAAIRNHIELGSGTPRILGTLANRNRISDSVVDTTRTLQDLRSRVAPRPNPGLSTAAARAYVDTVARVVAHLAHA